MRPERDRVFVARLGWGAVLAGLLAFVVLAPKPWSFPTGPDFFGPPDRPLAHSAWIGLWWASAINAVPALLFLVTAPLWARAPDAPSPKLPRPPRGRGLVLALLAACALAGALRWPLAQTGLWSDEAWSVKHTLTGYRMPARDGSPELVLRTPTWGRTLWTYYQPTNQVLYSVAGRVTLSTWQTLTGREPPEFEEWVVRLPALVAALGAVAALGLLLAEWGLPRAGVVAAFGMAIHPWAIRFGADGRSYSLVICFAALAALLLTRALRSPTWARWWRYGCVVFLMLWSHLFSLYLVATLALGALVALLRDGGSAATRTARVGRLVVVNAAAVLLVFQLMSPNLSQLDRWRGIFIGDVQTAHLTLPAVGHLWALAAVGIEAREPDVPEREPGRYASLAEGPPAQPWSYGVALAVMPVLIALGALRLLRRDAPVPWVALGLASAIPLALFMNWLNQDQWYSRFGTYALPVTVGFAAVGLEGALRRVLPGRMRGGPALAVALALALAAFQLYVLPQTRQLLSRPHTPSRQVSTLFAERLGTGREDGIRAVFGNVAGEIVVQTYDPWIRVPTDAGDVVALCDEARRSGETLLLAYGHPDRNRRNHPDLFALLDDPRLFREEALFDAIEVEHLMRVLRYTGRPVASDLDRPDL